MMPHIRNTIAGFRRGVSIDFVLTLLILAMLTYFIWGFDYVEGLFDSLVMNLLPAALPPLAFVEAMREKSGGRRFSWWNAELASFLLLALALAVSDKFDIDALGINVVVTMTSSPWLVIFVILIREKRILAIGMVPAAVALMVYWVVPLLSSDVELHYFLIPLTTVSLITAAWTTLVWILFKGVDRWPRHPTLGPLMEGLGMLSLFMPLMVLAIGVPRMIPGGDDLSVILAAIVGVVFGSVVSTPLARFLRSYGNLPSHRGLAGSNEVEESLDTGRCDRD